MSSSSIGSFGEKFTSRSPSKAKKAGRICSLSDCDTVLSIYNTTDRCSVHPDGKAPRVRGKTFY